jgi:hypothetical protein
MPHVTDRQERVTSALSRALARLRTAEVSLSTTDAAAITADAWLEVRAKIGRDLAAYREAVSEIDTLLGTDGSRNRMLRYLKLHVGEVVSKDELSGVAGVLEWARRVRELRQDEGWVIQSDVSDQRLRAGEYRLVSSKPDLDLARGWTLAKSYRGLKTAGGVATPKARVLEFLKAMFPAGADEEQLRHVAGSSEAAATAVNTLARDGWRVVDVDMSVGRRVSLGSLERIH